MSNGWQITYSLLAGAPAYINDDAREWATRWRADRETPGTLEFEGYTDQVDVFIRRPPNGRRVRFLTFMAHGDCGHFFAYETGNGNAVGPFDTREAAQAWIDANVPPEARVTHDTDYGFRVGTFDYVDCVYDASAAPFKFKARDYASVKRGEFKSPLTR